jgi:ketosteroid isomerase-like protein
MILMVLHFGCSSGPTDVSSQIKDANTELMNAFTQGDTTALSGFYTTDAKIFPANNQILDGQAAISKFWTLTMQMGIKKVLFETTTAQKFGNLAVEEGTYSLFVQGDQMVDQGKYIVTWKQEDGKWKIFRDIWNQSSPAPVKRASGNDTVLLILNYVKPDKVAQFEDFNKNYLSPAGAETNPQVKASVRMQKPLDKNADGAYTYVYFMDPYKGSLNYSIEYTLTAKYGKEKADEYMKMYIDCLKGGTSQHMFLVESDW